MIIRRVEEWTNHKMKIKPITGRIQMTRDNRFSLKVHVLANTLRPRCIDQTLGGSAAKRCFTNLVHMIGHCKNLPTSEVTQWHEQSTRVTFQRSTGEGARPLIITTIGARDNHQPPLNDPHYSKPSRWWQPPRVTRESRSKTWMPSATRCNHSINALWFLSQSHKDDESMMEMSGRALAKLTRLLCQWKMCKRLS